MSLNTRRKDSSSQFEKLISGGYGVAAKHYIAAKSWNSKYEAYRLMCGNNGISDPLFIAEAAFELAVTAPSQSKSDTMLIESIEKAHVAKMYRTQSPARAILTDMFTINLPLLTAIHIEKEHPNVDQIDKARKEAAKTIQTTFPGNKLRDYEAKIYAGAVAELGALVLLQRFSVEKLDGQDWTPVPTLISQDRDSKVGSSQNKNWDISVYTGSNVDISYMLQVKFGNVIKPFIYDESIAVVNIKNDLLRENETTYKLTSLVREISLAHSENQAPNINNALDERTDMLLNIIDPPVTE